MESKNMIGGIVSLAVVVICVAAIMMPVLSDATQTTETFTNEGVYYIVDDTESHSLIFDGSEITIDGVSLDTPSGEYTLLATESQLVRTSTAGTYLQFRGTIYATVYSCELTIADGTITGTYNNGTDDITANTEYTEYILATPNTESLIMTSYDGTALLNEDSTIMGRGLSKLYTTADLSTSVYLYIQLDGSIEDGITVTLASDAYTVDNIVVNAVADENYTDLYEFTSVTFDVTHTSSGAVTSLTYSAVVVPTEVTSELSQHLSSGEIALINAIPVLVIVSLVVAAVGMLVVRNRD